MLSYTCRLRYCLEFSLLHCENFDEQQWNSVFRKLKICNKNNWFCQEVGQKQNANADNAFKHNSTRAVQHNPGEVGQARSRSWGQANKSKHQMLIYLIISSAETGNTHRHRQQAGDKCRQTEAWSLGCWYAAEVAGKQYKSSQNEKKNSIYLNWLQNQFNFKWLVCFKYFYFKA